MLTVRTPVMRVALLMGGSLGRPARGRFIRMTTQRSADRQAARISWGYRNRDTSPQHRPRLADAMTTATAKRSSTRAATIVLFAVYLLLLTWIILWRLELPY